MKADGWNTHCFGRHLIDLPASAKIKEVYNIRGAEIMYLPGESEATLRAKIEKRQAELEAQKRNAGRGPMFFTRMQHGERGSTSLFSWKGPHSTRMLYRESYFIATAPWRAFVGSGDVSVDRTDVARQNADKLAASIMSRDERVVPNVPGFCIERGLVAGTEYRDESLSVGIELPEHPNLQIFIEARTGAEEDRLLDRVGGFFLSATRGLVPGLRILRKGQRNVGPIEAEEFATSASDKGQRVYAFAWEAQGKNGSLAEQNISVNLQVLEQSVVSEKTPYQPAFKSDEEALQLWDSIIESVRLRPGAV